MHLLFAQSIRDERTLAFTIQRVIAQAKAYIGWLAHQSPRRWTPPPALTMETNNLGIDCQLTRLFSRYRYNKCPEP